MFPAALSLLVPVAGEAVSAHKAEEELPLRPSCDSGLADFSVLL
jgi:hypothetical protein